MPSYDPLEDARLLEVDTYRGRIQAFCDMAGLNDLAGRSVVTIGSALGGEVIAAAQLKAETVIGFEIKDELVVRAREVAATFDLPVTFGQFDGVNLPPMPPVDVVLSGHVIEHTLDPRGHLALCLAALRPGGLVFLEFPTRFHWRELHTRRIGFEWLPLYLRRAANIVAGVVAAMFGDRQARADRRIVNRRLRQVSTLQVRRWLGPAGDVVTRSRPAPGIVRLVIRKV